MPIKTNTMKRNILFLSLVLLTTVSFAHNPDASTTMLVEKENNVWVLQISASLTAFQQEIRTNFSETPYKTPEEFQQMVLEHVKKNLLIRFNGEEAVRLSDGVVKLGHETKVVFEVFGVPSTIYSAEIKNTAFDDIYRSQSALVFLKDGFNKNHFILDDTNDHSLSLKVKGNEFVKVVENTASPISSKVVFVLIGLFGLGFLAQFIYKRQKSSLLAVR